MTADDVQRRYRRLLQEDYTSHLFRAGNRRERNRRRRQSQVLKITRRPR